MVPEHYRYGGGVSQSLLHPVAAVLLLAAIIAIAVLPRRHASLPILWMTLLLPLSQQVYVAGIHLFVLRLVILTGLIRILTAPKQRNSSQPKGLNGIDKAFLICIAAQAICPILLFGDPQALTYELGYVWDWMGAYFLFRWLIQDEKDVYRVLKYLAILMVPVAIGMFIERWKLYNVFSVLGGLPFAPEIREGKPRAQGVFAHSLMAGSFGAVLTPLFLMLWKNGKSKGLALLGFAVSTEMMLTSNSSTPLLGYAAGIAAIFLWPLRRKMRIIRWGISCTLIGLHMVMKAPVWFLIARVDLTGGSSSYHRAALVDSFIRHFSDWWLIGTNSNGDWGLDMFDVQNQYVNVGEAGGLIALVFFILMISRCFGRIGDGMKDANIDARKKWTLWLMGCSLFANVMGFFGVNYFDQSRIGWLALLAMIAACTAPVVAGTTAVDAKNDTEEPTSPAASKWSRPQREQAGFGVPSTGSRFPGNYRWSVWG